MSKGRWKESDDQLAHEAYAVFIRREKPSRVYVKADLARRLTKHSLYVDFLKLCLDYDDSSDLKDLRRGLLVIVRAFGISDVARRAGFSRMSLYRMLAKGGNPRLKNLVALFQALNLRPWLVDDAFIKRREPYMRPKNKPCPM